MKEYFLSVMDTLTQSAASIDESAFAALIKDCVDALNAGHKIIVSGLGKNVPVCDKFVGVMVSMGQSACFMNTNSAVHGDIGMVMSGDIVIILSKSGETEESIYLTSLLKKREVTIWLLSFCRESTMTHEIKKCLILDLNHEGDLWNIVPNNSTTMNLIVLQGLAMNIAMERGVTIHDFKRNHPGGHIGEQLKYV